MPTACTIARVRPLYAPAARSSAAAWQAARRPPDRCDGIIVHERLPSAEIFCGRLILPTYALPASDVAV